MDTNNKKTGKSVRGQNSFKEEFMSKLPKKLNKFGEWLMSDNRDGLLIINDMKAVLK